MITSDGNADNFDWIKGIGKYIDGLAIVWHGYRDAGYHTLSGNRGCGFITEREFYQNHSHSMNDFLLNPKIRPGDWIILRDSSEKLSKEFLVRLSTIIATMEKNGINSLFHYSKLLLFKKFEHQMFQGSPHWGLNKPREGYAALEQVFPEEHQSYSYSVRNVNRPSDHWIGHFMKYYLYDSSNHLLLGRENNMEEFQRHEEKRQQFKQYCENVLKIPLTIDSMREYFKNPDDKIKEYLNYEPILNDFYCHEILGHSAQECSDRRQKKKLFNIL